MRNSFKIGKSKKTRKFFNKKVPKFASQSAKKTKKIVSNAVKASGKALDKVTSMAKSPMFALMVGAGLIATIAILT